MFFIFQLCHNHDAVSHYGSLGHDLIYSNLPQLLCLPRTEMNLSSVLQSYLIADMDAKQEKQRRRIVDMSDVFDSGDESDDGFVTLKKKKVTTEESNEKQVSNEKKDSVEKNDKNEVSSKKMTVTEKIAADAVSAISLFYESMSFLDCYVSQHESHKEGPCSKNREFEWVTGVVTSGVCDDMVIWDESDWWKHNYMYDIIGQIQVTSLQLTNSTLEQIKARKKNLDMVQVKSFEEKMVLPVSLQELQEDKIKVCQESSEQKRSVLLLLKRIHYIQTKFLKVGLCMFVFN